MHKKIVSIVVIGLALIVVVGASAYYISQNTVSDAPVSQNGVGIKTYRDEVSKLEFKYPAKLNVYRSKNDGKVLVKHSIPFENVGDCDMTGGDELKKTLDDFNVTFKVVSQKLTLGYVDGQYAAGSLKGAYAYQGAEGCGQTLYYFPLAGNKTLVVERASIQALSGISTSWDLPTILKIPGVISKAESDRIFRDVLSSFKTY